jgi:hypothetical protein
MEDGSWNPGGKRYKCVHCLAHKEDLA